MGRLERIAVPVLAGVGNALMAQPLVRQLHSAARAGGGEPDLVVFARTDAIAAPLERLDEVSRVETFGDSPADFPRLITALRHFRADLCVIPYPSNRWQYSVIAAACGARRMLMHRYRVGYWRSLQFLPGQRVPARAGLHDVVQNLRLLRRLGVEPDESQRWIYPLEASDHEAARGLLAAAGVTEGHESLAAVHAGSGRTVFGASKRWSPARFAGLAGRLRDELGLSPVLLEGPDEEDVSREINRAVPAGGEAIPVVALRGPLHEAAAVLAACRIYVGSDSGLAHVAAAVGTPPVTLFGPSRPEELCPWGYRRLVVQTPAPCAPCFAYPHTAVTPHVRCRPPWCIDRIEVEAVMTAVRRGLAGRKAAAVA